MKKITLHTLALISVIFFSCEGNKDMLMYDTENSNFVYFAPPFKLDDYSKPTLVRVDSMVYSFGFAPLGTTEHVYKIPIVIAGVASDKDRTYKIEVISAETTAELNKDYAPIETLNTFNAGRLTDTLSVKIFSTNALKTGFKRIALRMLPSSDFEVGATENSKVILSFSNILNQPTWWIKWVNYLGPFCQEKYQYFISIYPLPEKGKPYDTNYSNNSTPVYWDNMPTSVVSSWYPITLMRIASMKRYFLDNVFYIDGDPAKGRVLLP